MKTLITPVPKGWFIDPQQVKTRLSPSKVSDSRVRGSDGGKSVVNTKVRRSRLVV